MELLSYFIIGVFIVSMWHFVYDGIIAPTIRFHLRNDLFLLRDRVRGFLMQDSLDEKEKETALFVHDGISLFIHRLSSLRLSAFYLARAEISRNIELKREIDFRINAIQNIQCDEIRDVFMKANKIIRKAIFFNSGAFLIPATPFFVLTVLPIMAGIVMASEFNRFIFELLAIPPRKARILGW